MRLLWILAGITWTVWLRQICCVVGVQVSERSQKTSVEYTTSIIQNGKWIQLIRMINLFLPKSPILPLDLNSVIFTIISAIQMHFLFIYINMFYLHFKTHNSFNHRRICLLLYPRSLQKFDPFKYWKLVFLAEVLFLVDYRKIRSVTRSEQ